MTRFVDALAALSSEPSALHIGRSLAALHERLAAVAPDEAAQALALIHTVQRDERIYPNAPLRETLRLLRQALVDRTIERAPSWPSDLLAAFGEESLVALIGAPTHQPRLAALAALYADSPALAHAPLEVVRELLDDTQKSSSP